MAKPSSKDEILLPMDWEYIDACNGFSFDMGGSVIKVIYISKDDWLEPDKRPKGSKGCLHLANFSRDEINQAIDLIQNKVQFKPRKSSDELLDIFCCGFGGTEYAEEFKNKLKIQCSVLGEFDCFPQGFMHMVKYYPRSDSLHPIYRPGFEAIKSEIKGTIDAMSSMGSAYAIGVHLKAEDFTFPQMDSKDLDKPICADKNFFPCGIVMCGSATGFTVVQADGTSMIVDGSTRGGKMFLGLASLLLGVKDYDELIDLCAKGEATNATVTNTSLMKGVKINSKDEQKDASGGDFYADFIEKADTIPEATLFNFGHAYGKNLGDFKKADLARALLESMVLDIAQTNHYIARLEGVKHVFFCGGFFNNRLARELLTVEWLRRSMMRIYNPNNKDDVQAHFLVHGQSLGGLGAFINSKTQWATNNTATTKDSDAKSKPSSSAAKTKTATAASNSKTGRPSSVTQKGKTSTTQSKTAAAKQTSAGSAKKTATKK